MVCCQSTGMVSTLPNTCAPGPQIAECSDLWSQVSPCVAFFSKYRVHSINRRCPSMSISSFSSPEYPRRAILYEHIKNCVRALLLQHVKHKWWTMLYAMLYANTWNCRERDAVVVQTLSLPVQAVWHKMAASSCHGWERIIFLLQWLQPSEAEWRREAQRFV